MVQAIPNIRPLESSVVKVITDWLELKKIIHLRLNTGKAFLPGGGAITLCPEGTPDLYVLRDGKSIFIEVKRDEKEKKTWRKKVENFKKSAVIAHSARRAIMQYKTMKEIEANGGDTYLVASLGEVMEIFK